MRILMVLDCEVNQPEVLPSFIESSALVLGLKYCQDGGELILERMAVNHDRAAGWRRHANLIGGAGAQGRAFWASR